MYQRVQLLTERLQAREDSTEQQLQLISEKLDELLNKE
jgi:hypothetical protein